MGNEAVKALKEQLAELEEKISKYKNENDIKQYLDAAALFHNYSFNNCLLIKAQCPGAKKVAGFNTWKKEFERFVMRGQHAIKILAPTFFPIKKDKEGKKLDDLKMIRYFRVVSVFDVSQTDGKPLPKWLETTPQQKVQILKNLHNLIKQQGIPYQDLNINKYNDSNLKAFNCNDGDVFAALVHDYAHHLLHVRDITKTVKFNLSELDKKVEAETAVYLVCKKFNIEHDSAKHIVLWGDRDKPFQHIQRVQKVASEIMGKIRLNRLVGGNN